MLHSKVKGRIEVREVRRRRRQQQQDEERKTCLVCMLGIRVKRLKKKEVQILSQVEFEYRIMRLTSNVHQQLLLLHTLSHAYIHIRTHMQGHTLVCTTPTKEIILWRNPDHYFSKQTRCATEALAFQAACYLCEMQLLAHLRHQETSMYFLTFWK